MSVYGNVSGIPMRAASDLRARKYHIARFVAKDVCDVASCSNSAVTDVYGVIQTVANSGHIVNVGLDGESQVVAGAAFAAGVALTSNSSGRAIAASSGDWMLGMAQEAAGADGELIRCLIRLPGTR